MSNWHDTTCSRPDIVSFDERPCCLSCGSMSAEAGNVLPSSDGQYDYSPVKQRSETRLVRLHPGSVADPIRCDIVIGRLEDLPSYEAISYTWADESGDSTKCRMVYIESCSLLITSNCEAALKRIRLRWNHRMIWMDAISINQDSNEERSHQVQLMPEIYARAFRVVVYIGEAEDESAIVLDHLNGYSLELFRRTALRRLLARRYFSRVWVIQEVALARRAVLVCGSSTVPWSCITLDNPTARKMLGPGDSIPLPPVIHFNAPRYKDIDHFPALLDVARPCKALDPRDKVFALIGLIAGAQAEGLIADYTLTVEQVYTNVAAIVARRAGCVAVMSRVSLNSGLPDLPSWVPDWSSPRDFQSGVTTLNDPKPASVNELQGMLTVYGIEVDKLSVLSNGNWSTAKGFDVSLEGNAQLGDVLYQICNTDNGDELYQQDPYRFTYPRYQEKVFDDLNNDLRYIFVLRKHFSNQFKIVGRCRLLRTHSGVIWKEWKKRREMEKEELKRPKYDWEKRLLMWQELDWECVKHMKHMKKWEWENQKQLQERRERKGEWEKQLREWREKEQGWEKELKMWIGPWKQWDDGKQLQEKKEKTEWIKPCNKCGGQGQKELEKGKQLQEQKELEKEKLLEQWEMDQQLIFWQKEEWQWEKQLMEWREKEWEWEKQLEWWEKEQVWVEREKQLTEWREKEWEWEKWKEWRMWKEWEREMVVKKIEII